MLDRTIEQLTICDKKIIILNLNCVFHSNSIRFKVDKEVR